MAARRTGGPCAGDGLLGRRREVEALGEWLDGARSGAGRLVLCAGEPGIGKTRLAQETAGIALAGGTTVAWGRCVEAEGSPAFWPWRQVLRSLGADADALLEGGAESAEDRFRAVDAVAEAVRAAAPAGGLVVVLDDVHWADEPSLLVLRHLAGQLAGAPVLVLATFRDVEPAGALARVLPDLVRTPAAERLDLRGFGLEEVRRQLERADASGAEAPAVLDLTAGNPLFVREVARAMADGTWRPDRPPATVLDLVRARLEQVSTGCRRLVHAAAVAGRDFPIPLVAAALGAEVGPCLAWADEAVGRGLLDAVGDGDYRFVHALTREAVRASLATADRVALHRALALALESGAAGDPAGHLAEIARHWSEVAPYDGAAPAAAWALRAADDAVRRLAFEEGVRLYRQALALGGGEAGDDGRCRTLVALGRAAHLAGDMAACAGAATAAADAARAAGDPALLAAAALVLPTTADPAVNAEAGRLCQQALAAFGDGGDAALKARLLAQQAHLAYYDGDQPGVEELSAAALGLARASGDAQALSDALHARKEACPGPAGLAERLALAAEMQALAARTDRARTAMWAELWRIEALVEQGDLAGAAEGLVRLRAAVDRVGGPVSAWHHDRAAACVAQAQGRYADAVALARRGFDRMQPAEPAPARGTWFAVLCAVAAHVGVPDDARPLVDRAFEPLPRYRNVAPLMRAHLLLCAGRPDEAAASYALAGPVDGWALPAFFTTPPLVVASLVTAAVGRLDDLAAILERLEPARGYHAAGDAVISFGPVELALGRGAAALGRLDQAADDLAVAAERADAAGARGFAAEARYHLAEALVARDGPGDRDRARREAAAADRQARALGMAAYVDRTAALLQRLGGAAGDVLSARELEVARLVAAGLTNRQIAERLVISGRTAQNHVQHILTKLGFTARSQIAAWTAGRNE
ncbi:MAG TPA: AAA family ATPase [Acidimicrobiales bacterium]|nr:AAA family ATPase [Acidimicrobiales bacterium]